MPGGRRAPASLALAAILCGCVGILGEQQFTIYIQNDLERAVIVRVGTFGDRLVNSGVNGRTPNAFGSFDGPIVVMDVDCRVLHELDVKTAVGSLWLRSDGTVRFVETEYDPDTPQLPHTDRCEDATN